MNDVEAFFESGHKSEGGDQDFRRIGEKFVRRKQKLDVGRVGRVLFIVRGRVGLISTYTSLTLA